MSNQISIPVKHTELEAAFDREQAFLLYTMFGGDSVKTAHALGMRAVDVLRMSEEESWNEKIKPILELRKSNKPGDFERSVNRAMNFCQARRLWLFLERVINRITGMSEEELNDYLFTGEQKFNADGSLKGEVKKLTTRALADLASACEKAHALTYLALHDVASDRARRKEEVSGNEDAGELHIRIARAMSEVKRSNTPRAELFDLKLEQASQQINAQEKPANPLDNDDH
jgi:hypothetical protein